MLMSTLSKTRNWQRELYSKDSSGQTALTITLSMKTEENMMLLTIPTIQLWEDSLQRKIFMSITGKLNKIALSLNLF